MRSISFLLRKMLSEVTPGRQQLNCEAHRYVVGSAFAGKANLSIAFAAPKLRGTTFPPEETTPICCRCLFDVKSRRVRGGESGCVNGASASRYQMSEKEVEEHQ